MHAEVQPSLILTGRTISIRSSQGYRSRSRPAFSARRLPERAMQKAIPRVNITSCTSKRTPEDQERECRRLIDFNRCGVPLVEMVTAPDLRSADEAANTSSAWPVTPLAGCLRSRHEKATCAATPTCPSAKRRRLLNPRPRLRTSTRSACVRPLRPRSSASAPVQAGKRVEAWTLEWDEDAGVLRKIALKRPSDYRYFHELTCYRSQLAKPED